MKLNVLYQFNEKYAPFAGASITSLFENNRHMESVTVFILGEELSDDSVKRFVRLAETYRRDIVFKETGTLIERMKEWGIPAYRNSYAANIRLFLPMVLDEELEKILYLDADTAIVGSLDELIEMEMGEASLAMAIDSLGGSHKIAIGLEADEYYFNSGVILFNMTNWKNNRCSERILEHIKDTTAIYSAPDQDLLNIVCKKEIAVLDPRYNMQPVHLSFRVENYFKVYGGNGYYEERTVKEAKDNIVIYHFFRFLGEFPWNKNNLHPDNDVFDRYIGLSPWNDFKKNKADSSLAMKAEKVLYRFLPDESFLRIFSLFHKLYVERKAEISG